MSWYITKCPPNGEKIILQVKEGSDQFWTGFWIRNSSLPVSKVMIRNENHSAWFKLDREEDGSFVAEDGLGEEFSMMITAIDGSNIGFSRGGYILVPEVFEDTNIQF